MLFEEVYGKYFSAMNRILNAAHENRLTDKSFSEIIKETAFHETLDLLSYDTVEENWLLLDHDNRSKLEYKPGQRPTTDLERRWLKTLLSDPRIQLFAPDMQGLEDVEPLFLSDTFVYYDQYSDGDPYTDPEYQKIFREVLSAIQSKRILSIAYKSRKCQHVTAVGIPEYLEYSQKDDKFRLYLIENGRTVIIPVRNIRSCEKTDEIVDMHPTITEESCELRMLVDDDRNALERVMMHFSHFEKVAEKLDEHHCRLTLQYDKRDETEVLIRILSFGTHAVIEYPESMREMLFQRIKQQMEYSFL